MQVEHRIKREAADSARMIPTPTAPDETTKRREITSEDTEDLIRFSEARLKLISRSLWPNEIAEAQQDIDRLKEQLAKMRAGTLKIWQRIPQKITGTSSGL